MPTRFTTASQPAKAARSCTGSWTLHSRRSTPGASRRTRWAARLRLSTRTSWPSARRRWARARPTKPVPPSRTSRNGIIRSVRSGGGRGRVRHGAGEGAALARIVHQPAVHALGQRRGAAVQAPIVDHAEGEHAGDVLARLLISNGLDEELGLHRGPL